METPVLPSLPQRVLSVIVSPGKLFETLTARPVWAGALILGAVLALVASMLAPAELFEATMRRQIQNRGGQVPDNLEQAVTIARIAGSVGALIMGPLFTAAIAGLVSLIFLFVLGDAGTYRQHLSMLAHAFLIPGIGNLAMLPLRIQAQDLQLRLSVGTFFPFLQDGWLASALSWLDLFGIWAWVLVALGASKIDPKRSWTSATVIILSLVLVVTFGLAAIFGR